MFHSAGIEALPSSYERPPKKLTLSEGTKVRTPNGCEGVVVQSYNGTVKISFNDARGLIHETFRLGKDDQFLDKLEIVEEPNSGQRAIMRTRRAAKKLTA